MEELYLRGYTAVSEAIELVLADGVRQFNLFANGDEKFRRRVLPVVSFGVIPLVGAHIEERRFAQMADEHVLMNREGLHMMTLPSNGGLSLYSAMKLPDPPSDEFDEAFESLLQRILVLDHQILRNHKDEIHNPHKLIEMYNEPQTLPLNHLPGLMFAIDLSYSERSVDTFDVLVPNPFLGIGQIPQITLGVEKLKSNYIQLVAHANASLGALYDHFGGDDVSKYSCIGAPLSSPSRSHS